MDQSSAQWPEGWDVHARTGSEVQKRSAVRHPQNHHYRNQDKATRKRMRQNDRRRKRMRQGRQVPWWRRIFGRQNRYR